MAAGARQCGKVPDAAWRCVAVGDAVGFYGLDLGLRLFQRDGFRNVELANDGPTSRTR